MAEAVMPFRRLPTVEEVTTAVAFLASEDSGMMTGAIIDFDQGVIGAGHSPRITDDEILP
jgi:NAD(P)-dependent dehydrogenase (short-subunit alcohol dehydrogenase family)